MSEPTTNAAQDIILVEFAPRHGVQQVAIFPGDDMAEKSAQALDKAMTTIRQMGYRITETVKSINVADRPSKVELEFGLKFDAEAGALVARASTEAAFKVVLTWQQPDKKHE